MKNLPNPTGLAAMTAVLALLLAAPGCQTGQEPITGRPQFILISAQEETAIGLRAWEQIIEEKEASENQTHIEAVERVGGRLAAAVDPDYPGFDWEFRVFASEQVNAFCLPGGKIGVYDGIFEFFDNDAELAAVLGHEIAHAVARHGAERMTQAMLFNLGALGVAMATQSQEQQTQERWLLAYVGLGTLGYILPYSRRHEFAADHMGMIFMARAGYDPRAAMTFWSKFAGDTSGLGKALQFISTHPVGEARIERLRENLPEAIREYEAATQNHGLGRIYH